MKQYRHGDLLIVLVESIPEDAKPVPGGTLAEGEATGHAHTLERPAPTKRKKADNGPQLFERDGQLWFRAAKPTAVVHQEHARIALPAGQYRVIRQREYCPAAPPRQVAD